MCNKIHEKAIDHGEDNAREEIDIEAGSAPLALERGTYKVVKIKGDESEHAGARRDEHKRDQPPDLPVENVIGIEHHIWENTRIDHVEQPHNGVGNGDIANQIRNAEIRMLQAKGINLFSHGSSSFGIRPVSAPYHTISERIFL